MRFILLLYACMWLVGADAVFAQPHGQKLPPEQQATITRIVQEARPTLDALMCTMREKMLELKAIAYDSHTDPDVLQRLGQELQHVRDALRQEIILLDKRLEAEAGIVAPPRGRGCAGLMPHR